MFQDGQVPRSNPLRWKPTLWPKLKVEPRELAAIGSAKFKSYRRLPFSDLFFSEPNLTKENKRKRKRTKAGSERSKSQADNIKFWSRRPTSNFLDEHFPSNYDETNIKRFGESGESGRKERKRRWQKEMGSQSWFKTWDGINNAYSRFPVKWWILEPFQRNPFHLAGDIESLDSPDSIPSKLPPSTKGNFPLFSSAIYIPNYNFIFI